MSEPFSLRLLGGFGVYRDQHPLALPPSCQRMVALAALKRRTVHRICATLWPYAPPPTGRGEPALRLWRLRPLGAEPLLVLDASTVTLAPGRPPPSTCSPDRPNAASTSTDPTPAARPTAKTGSELRVPSSAAVYTLG